MAQWLRCCLVCLQGFCPSSTSDSSLLPVHVLGGNRW